MLDRKRLEEALRWVQSDSAIAAKLGPAPESLKFSISIFDRVASTNQTVWELLALGAPPGTIAIAREQTAGRGQWGRQWQSPVGGLYLSMAIAPNLAALNAGALTMASAWAIATSLREVGIPVLLKWPNDLILAKRKLGGILTETRVHRGQIAKAVVGVGINWSNPVPKTGINLQSFLADFPTDFPTDKGAAEVCLEKLALEKLALEKLALEKLAAIVAWAIAVGTELAGREGGIETLLPSYQDLLTNMGQVVTVEGRGGAIVGGAIAGVTNTGELRVRLDPAGDTRENPQNQQNQPKKNAKDTSDDLTSEILLKPGTVALGY